MTEVARKLDAEHFHLHEKPSSMRSEQTVSVRLRGYDRKTSLIKDNLPYGDALAARLIQKRLVRPGDNLVMVGDGLGYNSHGFQRYSNTHGVPINMTAVDLSPRLLETQRRRNPNQTMVHGNALELSQLPLRQPVRGIMANEVIADFPVVNIDVEFLNRALQVYKDNQIATDQIGDFVDQYLNDYDVMEAPVRNAFLEAFYFYAQYDLQKPPKKLGNVLVNTGSMEFLEQAYDTLPQNGWLWLSEYGGDSSDFWSETVDLKGHSEWSIKFNHLKKVAEKIGFKVEMESLAKFIGIKTDEIVIVHDHGPENQPIYLTAEEAMQYYAEDYNGSTGHSISSSLNSGRGFSPSLYMKWTREKEQQIGFNLKLGYGPGTTHVTVEKVGTFVNQFYSFLAVKK